MWHFCSKAHKYIAILAKILRIRLIIDYKKSLPYHMIVEKTSLFYINDEWSIN